MQLIMRRTKQGISTGAALQLPMWHTTNEWKGLVEFRFRLPSNEKYSSRERCLMHPDTKVT